MLVGVARSKNTGGSYGAARPEWPVRGRVPNQAQKSEEGLLSWIAGTSAISIGGAADERFRIDDHVRDRLAFQCQEDAQEGAGVFVGRVVGWGGNANFPPRNYDSCCSGRERKKRNRHHRRHGAHLG